MPGKFEIYKDRGGKHRFRLKATNGEIILASQGYTSIAAAKYGVESVRKNSQDDARFERKEGRGKFRFNLRATNGQVVGTSKSYNTLRAREIGVRSVASNAPNAKVID